MFSPSAPAAPPPLVRQSFEKDTQGWTAIGASAVVRRADLPVAADSPAGSGLLFEYRIDPGTVDALTLGVEAGSWSLAQRVSFQVQAASRTTLILSVQEKQGGRWSAVVHCSGPGWQRVRLDAGDFQLSRDAGAPVDPDERLDFGAVEHVVLVDFAV
ncbi:MAG: carbohydrate binding domain-containing protein, partial [Armatimonadota bacterium]